jgi:hypothetical protein
VTGDQWIREGGRRRGEELKREGGGGRLGEVGLEELGHAEGPHVV